MPPPTRQPLSPRARARLARSQVTLSLMLLSAAGTLVGVLTAFDWAPLAGLGLAVAALLVLALGLFNLALSRRS